MRDWSYLESDCRAYDAACVAAGWPVPARGGRRARRPPHRPTPNGARDAELCRRAAEGASVVSLAQEYGLSPARAYQITRQARRPCCRQCGAGMEAGRRKFCAACATTRKRERIRRWGEAKRRERRQQKPNATERAA